MKFTYDTQLSPTSQPKISKERIPEILGLLQKYWEQHPELRLLQIVEFIGYKAKEKTMVDPFYIEDDIVVDTLEELLKKQEER
ncbi:MAG: hypothetical protein K0S80_3752 [Neobacillus sp.]|nr:hypothetical protein [Neobacillus sp.]